MASIKYLNNITLLGNDLELARIHPVNGAPTAYGNGQMYYDTGTDKLRVYENGAWVNIVTGNDVDTTYDLTAGGSTNGTAVVKLTDSDGNEDDVLITGANGTSVTRTANTNTIVVTGATVNNSTITLSAGTGLKTGGSFTLNQGSAATITFDVDYDGTDNIILSATDLESTAISASDSIIYNDNDDNEVKYGLVSDLPFTNTQGTLTGIGEGDYINVDNSTPAVPEISADATTTATASKLVARDADGFAYAATPTSGDSSTKVATTAFVQNTLVGQLEFKGGFNANTGAIDGGSDNLTSGNSRVAIAVGDMYVVSTAGNFFGNAATPLTPGDSVIVQEAAAQGASVEADFIIVQSDTDVATASTIGIGNVNQGTGISVAYSNGTATVTNSDRGSSQDIFKTIAVSGQSDIVADTNADTLTFAAGGATSITTNATSDTITISSVNTQYSALTTSTLGLAKIRYDNNSTPAANSQSTTASRTYGVTKNSSDQLIVNVPWTDNSGPVDSVSASSTNNRLGIEVSPTTGAVIVGLNINGLTQITENIADDDVIPFYDDTANANGKHTASEVANYVGNKRSFANTGPASAGTSYTITSSTHGLGTDSTLIAVQLIEVSTGNTIYADVNRGASGLITINFASNQGVDSIKALLSLHG